VAISGDLARVMTRLKAVYRSWAIPCAGKQVYAPRYRGDDVIPQNRTKASMIRSEKGEGMSKGKHTEAEMIAALKEMEAGRKAEDVAREVGVSKHTIYAWKAKYGGMDVSEAQEVRQLREENGRLKKLVADLSLDKDALQSVIRKNGWSSQS
jgi:putative transposase